MLVVILNRKRSIPREVDLGDICDERVRFNSVKCLQ